MTDIEVGKRYRITSDYGAGTTVTVEGKITEIRNGVAVFAAGERASGVSAFITDRMGLTITVEDLPDPLPTTPGSVVRESTLGLLMRGEQNTWISPHSNHVLSSDLVDYKVIFDAGAAS